MELWTIAILPVAVVLLPLIWKDVISPRVNPPAEEKPVKGDESVTIGQPVDFASAAVNSLREQLTDERAHHADERAQHDRCDALLAQHGHDVPHD